MDKIIKMIIEDYKEDDNIQEFIRLVNNRYNELKGAELIKNFSTFPKEKKHNSSSKKDCYASDCYFNVDNECVNEKKYLNCNKIKRSPS